MAKQKRPGIGYYRQKLVEVHQELEAERANRARWERAAEEQKALRDEEREITKIAQRDRNHFMNDAAAGQAENSRLTDEICDLRGKLEAAMLKAARLGGYIDRVRETDGHPKPEPVREFNMLDPGAAEARAVSELEAILREPAVRSSDPSHPDWLGNNFERRYP